MRKVKGIIHFYTPSRKTNNEPQWIIVTDPNDNFVGTVASADTLEGAKVKFEKLLNIGMKFYVEEFETVDQIIDNGGSYADGYEIEYILSNDLILN